MIARAAVVLFLVLTGDKTMAPDDEQLHRLREEFGVAWSKGDAAAAARFWTEDGVRVGAAGDIQHGRKEIAAALDRLLNGPFKGASVRMEKGTVRMLSADVALYQGAMQIDVGQGRPPIKGYYLDVMKKVGGAWLILEGHPKLFPPPPPKP